MKIPTVTQCCCGIDLITAGKILGILPIIAATILILMGESIIPRRKYKTVHVPYKSNMNNCVLCFSLPRKYMCVISGAKLSRRCSNGLDTYKSVLRHFPFAPFSFMWCYIWFGSQCNALCTKWKWQNLLQSNDDKHNIFWQWSERVRSLFLCWMTYDMNFCRIWNQKRIFSSYSWWISLAQIFWLNIAQAQIDRWLIVNFLAD